MSEGRQIRAALMLSTAELGRTLHEKSYNTFSFENEDMG